jgi:hypothetical protein
MQITAGEPVLVQHKYVEYLFVPNCWLDKLNFVICEGAVKPLIPNMSQPVNSDLRASNCV